MFLKRFVYVNWGSIPPLEFDFGPVNLFSGGNGSGKTTAADAIQTVMTAAHESLFQYNPGQDETTQRGRGGKRVRTLASYVLGCDDGSYARLEPTDGYLAAVFHATRGESAEPFTAVIAVRAWLDTSGNQAVARQDDAQFFILPGEQLSLGHFVREAAGDRYVVPLPELQNLLIHEFGKRRVEKYDTKKAYLGRLYGALRGRSDAVPAAEATAAARAFSRFMAYKPVQGINRFVAEEILERRDLGEAIRSVSSQLKTIHGMERDAARLAESVALLDKARAHSATYIDRWIELLVLDYTLAQSEYLARQQEYLQVKQQQAEQQGRLEAARAGIRELAERGAAIHDELVSLEAQRQGVDALRRKDELERQMRVQDQTLVEQAQALVRQDQRLHDDLARTTEIRRLLTRADKDEDLDALRDLQAEALAGDLLSTGKQRIDIHTLLQKDLSGDLTPLEAQLDAARHLQQQHSAWRQHWYAADGADSRRERLSRIVHQRRARYEQLDAQRRQKQTEIERLNASKVTYPAYVERALQAIRSSCPAADPRVLCDHVEVGDSRWQMAVEGYIGGARFSILVETDHEADAIRIVRAMPGRDNRARVIQGAQALRDAARASLPASSIVHVLEFSHAVARAYLAASYGSVQRVESAEELRGTRRGLTADGMASGNYSMWRCDLPDTDLVFGKAARERALRAKIEELQRLETERNLANDQLQAAVQLLRAVDGLNELDYAGPLAAIMATHREIRRLQSLLDQLDLSRHEALEHKLAELRRERDALQSRDAELKTELGALDNQLQHLEQRARRLDAQQADTQQALEDRETAVREIAPAWPDFEPDSRLNAADAEARDLKRDHAQAYRHEVETALHNAERLTSEAIRAHNQHARPVDAIAYLQFQGDYDHKLFDAICKLQRQIDSVYNRLRNNILVEKREQLGELKRAFNNTFVTHLCHAIHQSINDGKRQIALLNQELQHHRFGSDRETFRFQQDWIPEFRDYARFFEDVLRNPSLGEGATLFDADLKPRSRAVLDEIMAKLLDEDEQRALRDLERIADYRNYHRYEIFKEVEGKAPIALSEYGTGSGGQLETPAYIIRSAAITSAFRFAEGDSHLRMVLVDEAFSKMDETRSREVISYLTESLGLQLIFIMPTSKCGPYMDLISHETVFAKVASEQPRGQLHTRVLVDRKQCNKDRIKALWAQHRRTVYQQAELDFMQDVLAEGG